MKIQFRELTIIAALVLTAQMVQASEDCSTESKDAVDDCTTISQSAEQANSDVASGMAGNAANINQGGTNLTAVSNFGKSNLNAASKQCTSDFDTCKKACGDAFQAATDPTVQETINQNLKTCNEKITAIESRLTAGQSQLASASAGGQATSGASQYDDSSVDSEKAQTPAGTQQTGFASTVATACRVGYMVANCYLNPAAVPATNIYTAPPPVLRIAPGPKLGSN
jgi:hypothetical protein